MKKICVNEDACIGCGACVAIDSTHFDFNEDGLSEVISNENVDTDEVKNAIASCPTNAISYVVDVVKNDNSEKANELCQCENCHCEECHCDEDGCHCDNCEEDVCECDDCQCDECNCDHKECHSEEK